MPPTNLFSAPPRAITAELFQLLHETPAVRIERIISPPHTLSRLHLQPADEWILLLQGAAELCLRDEQLHLTTGDCLLIAANTPHQVIDTSADPLCIWLAIHMAAHQRGAG